MYSVQYNRIRVRLFSGARVFALTGAFFKTLAKNECRLMLSFERKIAEERSAIKTALFNTLLVRI